LGHRRINELLRMTSCTCSSTQRLGSLRLPPPETICALTTFMAGRILLNPGRLNSVVYGPSKLMWVEDYFTIWPKSYPIVCVLHSTPATLFNDGLTVKMMDLADIQRTILFCLHLRASFHNMTSLCYPFYCCFTKHHHSSQCLYSSQSMWL
jgi:hypothetical protein